MGIDVWVRRTETARSSTATAVPKDREAPVPAAVLEAAIPEAATPEAPIVARDRPVGDGSTAVDLTALAGGGAVVVSAVEEASDRKILQGVFTAVSARGSDAHVTRFLWPQPGVADRGPDSMRIAYRAFLKGQGNRARASWLVLLGDAASTPIPEESFDDGLRILIGPSPAQLRRDPDAKRALWQKIATYVNG